MCVLERKLTTKASGYHSKALAQEADHGILLHKEIYSIYGQGS